MKTKEELVILKLRQAGMTGYQLAGMKLVNGYLWWRRIAVYMLTLGFALGFVVGAILSRAMLDQ